MKIFGWNIKFEKGKPVFWAHQNKGYLIGDTNPQWLETDDLSEWYRLIPHVNFIIGTKAKMFGNMRLTMRDIDTKEIDTSTFSKDLLKKFQKPNPLQGGYNFIVQGKVFFEIFGESLVYTRKPTRNTEIPTAFFNLPNDLIEYKPTGKLFKQLSEGDIISTYHLKINGVRKESYDAREVAHFRSPQSLDIVESQSSLEALKLPASNLYESYKARNVLTAERGAIGMITNDTKDDEGGLPLDADEKKMLQEKYSKGYGTRKGQDQIIVTNANVKWQPMNFNVEDLQLLPQEEHDFMTLIDAFGLDKDMFAFPSSAKFTNKREARKAVYENTIIPEAIVWASDWSNYLKLMDRNLELWPSYDHLSIMQQDAKKQAEVRKLNQDFYGVELLAGRINEAEYKIFLDL